MNNTVARICKTAAVILFLLILAGGIFLGTQTINGKFSVTLMLVTWISGFLLCLLVYAAGELISNVWEINEYFAAKQEEEQRSARDAGMAQAREKAKIAPGKEWRCGKCGTNNGANALTCRDCGEYR